MRVWERGQLLCPFPSPSVGVERHQQTRSFERGWVVFCVAFAERTPQLYSLCHKGGQNLRELITHRVILTRNQVCVQIGWFLDLGGGGGGGGGGVYNQR